MVFGEKIKEYIIEDDRPFPSCHAATLIWLPGGDILAAWFGGTKESAPDEAIWCAKRKGDKWLKPLKVADKEGIPHWNPVLYRNDEGRIFLYYKVGLTIPKWYTLFITSDDEGETWSQPKELVEGDIGGRGPVKNKPIKLKDGTLVAPASLEVKFDGGENWDAFVDLSYDGGKTWTMSEMVPLKHPGQEYKGDVDERTGKHLVTVGRKGIIQPTLWESEPNHVHMLLRSTEAYIFRSDSYDGGKTWCPAYPTTLPNNNSGIDLVKMDSGILALVYNPVGMYKGPRSPLIMSTSIDNGETWEQSLILEYDPGEYSYPAIISKQNELFIAYTWQRERIVFWKIKIS